MNNSIKRVTKKALSVLLAVAMLFSVLSVAFTAFADAAVYTVVNNKPVIPAKQGTVIDLSKIDVQFEGNTYNGANITWSTTDTTGGVYVNDTAKTVDVAGSDIYEIKATVGEESKIIYIMQPAANGSMVIYNHNFSADDLKAIDPLVIDGVNYAPYGSTLNAYDASTHVAANPTSDWALFNTSGASLYGTTQTTTDGVEFTYDTSNPDLVTWQNYWSYTDGKGISINTNRSGWMYIKPTSAAGQIISAFADYTIDYSFYPKYADTAGSRTFYLLGKYSLNNAAYGANAGFVLGSEKYAGVTVPGGYGYTYTSLPVLVSNNQGTDVTASFVSENKETNIRVTFNGENIYYGIKKAGEDAYTTVYEGVAREGESVADLKGTIAINNAEPSRQYNKSLSVTIDLTAEAALMDGYLSDLLIVKASKPAIPLTAGKKLNLSSIYFEFDDGTVARGADITWSTEETGVSVDNTAKTVSMFTSGMYAITATYAKASAPKTIYIIEPDSNGLKQLYYHAFTEADVDTTTSNFVSNSDWTLLSGGGKLVWNTIGGVQTGDALSCGYVLKPTSEAGKLVSQFRDIIIDANIAFSVRFGAADNSYDFSLVGRANWADNEALTGAATYAGGGFNGYDAYAYDWANLNVSGVENYYEYTTKNTTQNTFYAYKVSLIGNDITISKNGVEAPIELSDAQKAKIADTKGGTIYLSDYNTRLVFKDIRVTVPFTEEEIAIFSKPEITSDLIIVKSGNPVIPMEAGTTVSVADIFFEFNSGKVVSGASIEWASEYNSVTVDNDKDTITLFTAGRYDITASFGGEDKTLYVITPDENNQHLLMNYIFSADDVVTDIVKDTPTYFGADNTWIAYNESNGNASIGYDANKGISLSAGNTNTHALLNPESTYGKLVSDFADYTIETQATSLQLSWGDKSGSTYYIYGRYNLASSVLNNKNDTYLGLSSEFYTGSNSYVIYSGANALSQGAAFGYNASTFSVSTKMTYKGNDLTVWQKNAADANYTKVYQMSADTTSDASKLSAARGVTKAGTVGWYSYNIGRASIKFFKVTIDIDTVLFNALKATAKKIDVIPNGNPTLPMEVYTKLDLNNLYFEFDSGKAIKGSEITWSLNDTTGGAVLSATDKTITVFKAGRYDVTATYGDETMTVYAYALADNETKLEIYNHTFSADDFETNGDVEYFFTKDSEWFSDAVYDEANARYSNVRWDATNEAVVAMYTADFSADGGGFWLGDWGTGTIFLDPNSESGKLVSSFRNIIVEADAVSTVNFGTTGRGSVGPIARLQIDPVSYMDTDGDGELGFVSDPENPDWFSDYDWQVDGFDTPWSGNYSIWSDELGDFETATIPVDRVATLWRIQGGDDNTAITVDVSGNGLSGTRTVQDFKFYDAGDNGNKAAVSTQTLSVIDNTITATLQGISPAGELNTAVFTLTDAQNMALSSTKAGTIGFHMEDQCRGGVRAIRAYIAPTKAEKELMAKYSEKLEGVYVVPASKPAIPMEVNNKLDLSDIYFEMESGALFVGSELTWESADNSVASVNDVAKTVTMLANGTCAITATKDDQTQTYYLVTADENGEYVIYNHNFTALDLDESGFFTEDSEWATTFTSALIIKNDGIFANSASADAFYVRPESATGIMLSKFADIAIEYTGVASGIQERLSGPVLRLNLGNNEAFDDTDAHLFPGVFTKLATAEASWMRIFYAGVRQDGDRHVMLADQDGAAFHIVPGATYTQRATVVGKDLSVSYKTADKTDPTIVYTSTMDLSGYPIPDTILSGGTAGFRSNDDVRNCNVSNFKAIITFDEAFVRNIKGDCSEVKIMDSTKPAIPMNVGQTLDLKLITLTAKDGTLIDGADATWTISDDNAYVVYDQNDKVLIAYSSGYATLTATDALGNKAVIYVTIADSEGEYTIYYHKFSLNDLTAAVNGNYVFTEDSEWYGKNTSGDDDTAIKLGYNTTRSDGMTQNFMCATDDSVGWAMYLRPDSASGIKVSAFSDIIMNVRSSQYMNNPNFFSTYMRLQVNEDGTFGNNFNQMIRNGNTGNPATWVRVDKNNYSGGYIREIRNITTPDDANFAPMNYTQYYATYTVSGAENGSITYAKEADYSDAVTITHSPEGATISTADGASKDLAYDIARSDASDISAGGTIGFGGGIQTKVAYDFVEVQITFTEEELAYFDQFKADNNSVKVQYFEDISKYRGSTYTAPTAPYGKVFAGWYTDENCTVALESTVKSGAAYAKFVSSDVFSVKWQITDPAETTNRVVNGKTRKDNSFDLRLVSTVDTTKYNRVGFTLERSDGRVAGFSTDTVYKKITGEKGGVVYDPTVFSDISKYFITVNVTNFDWATWGDELFTATTVFETKDGTTVFNTAKANTFKPSTDTQAIDLAEAEMYDAIQNNKDTISANKIYYVSNSGTDSSLAGTKSYPYKTITYALAKARAYKESNPTKTIAILLKRGDTFRENLWLFQDLSVGAYGSGDKPKVYGSWDVAANTASSDIPVQKIDSFTIDLTDASQEGLNGNQFTAPEGTDLWSIDLTNAWGVTHVDVGSIFFVSEVENNEVVVAADKKWFRGPEHDRYDARLDDLADAYDFFYDYNNKMIYVLIPEGKNFSDYAHVEVQNTSAVILAQSNTADSYACNDRMSNITLQNLELRYGNFGVSASDQTVDKNNATNPYSGMQNLVCDGLEISWIGGARQANSGNYTSTQVSSYTRLGNGIEVWGGAEGMEVKNCYITQVYDAAVTFQYNLQTATLDAWKDINVDFDFYKDITITNNLLTDNVYNFEYFMSVNIEEDQSVIETYDHAKMNNIVYSNNISRTAGGTADNNMWGLAHRYDRGVSSHIKGSTTYGNHTVLDEIGDSTFVIENNVFDGAVDNALSVSASNEGGEPEFRNNTYVVTNNEKFDVNGKKYDGDEFVKYVDTTSLCVIKPISGSVYASARTLSAWGGVEAIDNLANTNYKLANGQNINVGYLGGSVTAGTGADNAETDSWRALTTAYLTEKGAATGSLVTEVNAAWGGTGSSWGFFRMNEQLLKNDLDLVFVEFSINDVYAGLGKTQSALYMEGIVKKLREVNPYMDIVIVFITDEAHVGGPDWDNKVAHKAVAEHYGIPTIDVGAALAEDMAATGNDWSNYSEDIVHPNSDTYAIYATEVCGYLNTVLTGEATAYKTHEAPATDLVSNQATITEIVTVDRVSNYKGFTVKDCGYTSFVEEAFYGAEGSTLTYSFTGTTFGLFLSNLENAPNTVTLKATIDGKETVTKTFKGGDVTELPLVDNLKNGAHTVKLEIVSGGEIAIGGILIAK